MANYTLATIARKLSASNRGRFVTEDTVWSWVKDGSLYAEHVPVRVQNWGKYPFWVEEAHLKEALADKGFDVDALFSKEE